MQVGRWHLADNKSLCSVKENPDYIIILNMHIIQKDGCRHIILKIE